MIEKFKSYFAKLERLSIAELDRSAEKLVVAEHGNIARLIAHIAEMSSRRAALELGYKNLFDYCVRRLNLSEGAVPARIHVANVSRKFPQLLAALAENRISLTVASLLAGHVNEKNVEKLIADCAGKTRKATEEYLVAIKPKPVVEPSIRRQPRRPAESPSPSRTTKGAPPVHATPVTVSARSKIEPARPEVFNFRFAADREFKDKFERLAEVMGVDNAQQHMAELFGKALDLAPSTRKTRSESSNDVKNARNQNLVQTRFPKTDSRPRRDTCRPRCRSGCTPAASISASTARPTEPGAHPERVFSSSTCARSASTGATTSDS